MADAASTEPADATERVRITGIAAGGAGVGRLQDGRVAFVHRTAPGDLAEVRVTSLRPRFARGRLERLLEPGPARRSAPCPHYARCGGCTLEHLEYSAQLDAKAAIVRDALARIGGVDVVLPEVVPSPRELRYRNRVSMTLLRLPAGRVVAGFHEIDRPERIVDIDGDCLLPERTLAEALDALRSAWGESARRLPAGRRLRLTLRSTVGEAVGLLVEGGRGRGEPDALLAEVSRLTSIWHRPRGAGEARRLAGRAGVRERWSDAELELEGAVFVQVNREAAALLDDYVLELAGDVRGARVVDAYCGVGLHARRLAGRGGVVIGIELDRHAIEEAQRGAPSVTFVQGSVDAHLPDALPAELLILNPPRAGLGDTLPSAIARRPSRRLIYISCDPATLARDLRRLQPDYRLRSLRCFDLFPQTAHVETVAELECATS